MPKFFTCPKGHVWEDAFGVSLMSNQTLVCPVCGVAVEPLPTEPPPPGKGLSQPPMASLVNFQDLPPPPPESETFAVPGMAQLASMTAIKPATVAGYEILGELGRGGMGVVYKARQTSLNRLVALKMVLAGAHAGATGLVRFQAEAEAVARLQHPNIVQIYEVGQQNDLPYFSMEFVDGGSLAGKAGDKPQPARWSAEMVETLARAMHAAHQKGIIHRDLKPANVLLTREGAPKITDFGLAKQMDAAGSQTRTGDIMGTPSYMSPEQAEGRIHEIGPLTDVWALGAILYELLTGRPPFEAEAPVDTLLQVLHEEPISPIRLLPKLPRDLDTICLKCLQKEPAKRYASALELADDLRRFLNKEPIQARPIGAGERLLKWARRNPKLAVSLGLFILSVVAGLVVAGWYDIELSKSNADLQAALTAEETERARAEANQRTAEQNEKQAKANELEAKRQQALAETNERKANEQRNRAEENLRLARKAVDHWMTVMGRDLLEDVPGFDDKRRELLGKAVDFYKSKPDLDSTDPEVRRETGMTHYNLGTLYRGLQEFDLAQKEYALAVAWQRKLVNDFPDRREYRQDLANSYNYWGEALRLQGGRQALLEAEKAYNEALKLQTALVKEAPEPAYLQELARTHYNRGILRMDTGRREDAEKDFNDAIALGQQAVALLKQQASKPANEPDYRQGLARSYINRGILLKDTQRWEAAGRDYHAAIQLLTGLHQEFPFKTAYRSELAVSHVNRGNLYNREGRFNEAREDFDKARALLERLCDDFPTRPRYRYELSNCLNSLAAIFFRAGERDRARATCEEARKIQEALVKDGNSGEIHEYQSALGRTLDNLAQLVGPVTDKTAAEIRSYLEKAETWHLKAVASNPRHRDFCQSLRSHYDALARFQLRRSDPAGVEKTVDRLLAVFPDDWQRRYRAANLLAQCVPLAGTDPKKAQHYADRAAALLDDAVKTGMAADLEGEKPDALRAFDELKKPSPSKKADPFEALRKREDFGRLLGVLAEKARPKAKSD